MSTSVEKMVRVLRLSEAKLKGGRERKRNFGEIRRVRSGVRQV